MRIQIVKNIFQPALCTHKTSPAINIPFRKGASQQKDNLSLMLHQVWEGNLSGFSFKRSVKTTHIALTSKSNHQKLMSFCFTSCPILIISE